MVLVSVCGIWKVGRVGDLGFVVVFSRGPGQKSLGARVLYITRLRCVLYHVHDTVRLARSGSEARDVQLAPLWLIRRIAHPLLASSAAR